MSSPAAQPARFQAGFAHRLITPPVGTSLAGFFHDRVSRRIRDDLFARAIVLRHDSTALALVGLDLICVDSAFVDQAKSLIQRETGIPPHHVLISASHTHTGPEVRLVGNKVPRNESWLTHLPRLIADAVAEAAQHPVPVTIRGGQMTTEGYLYNRLFRLKNGAEQMGRWNQPENILGPAGPVDPTLQTLSFVDEQDQVRGLVVNVGLHPVTVAGGEADFLSADWPGEMARHLEKLHGPNTLALFLQGSCGDVYHLPDEPRLRPQGGPAKTLSLGRGLAGAATYAAERAEPETTAHLAVLTREIQIPYYTRTPEIWAEVAELKQREKLDAAQKYFIQAVEEWPFDHQVCAVPLQIIRIGEIALVALPAQVFTRIALEMKHWSPARQTLIVELANARVTSYVPTADQVERGAYGSRPVVSRWLSVDAGRRMIDGVLVMLQDLWGETAPLRK